MNQLRRLSRWRHSASTSATPLTCRDSRANAMASASSPFQQQKPERQRFRLGTGYHGRNSDGDVDTSTTQNTLSTGRLSEADLGNSPILLSDFVVDWLLEPAPERTLCGRFCRGNPQFDS